MLIYIQKSLLAVSAIVLAALAASVQAAQISWNTFTLTGDVSDVSTNGVLVEARNGGNSDRTVNGVTFQSVANSTNLFDSLFANDNIGSRGEGTVVTDPDYIAFLRQGQRSGRYGDNTPPRIECTQDWATVELTGLTNGCIYEFQIWSVDAGVTADGVVSNAALVVGDGLGGSPEITDPHVYTEVIDRGTGQYAIGTFTADGSTQYISVRMRMNLTSSPSWSNNDHWSNGWQLRLIYSPPRGTVIVIR